MVHDVAALLTMLAQHGPLALTTGTFAAMWYFERREVKALQSRLVKVTAHLLSMRNARG